MKKKLLFIHHAVGWGGAPINMINVIEHLDKSKFDIEVLLIKDSVVSEQLKKRNIKYSVVSNWYYRKYYSFFSHTVIGMIKWYKIHKVLYLTIHWLLSKYIFSSKVLSEHEFDIVHLNSSVLTDWLASCKKKGSVVIHIQEPFSNGYFGIRSSFFRRQMKKYADKIITISHDNARRIGIPEKTEVIYNYSDIPLSQPCANSYSSKKVLYLGGNQFVKGFYTLVNALDYLNKGVIVYFGGNYEVKSNSINMIKNLISLLLKAGNKKKNAINKMRNHKSAVEIGVVSNISEYLDDVCCLVAPSSVTHFSRPAIEAHLHKKPAIVTDIAGMDEIITHEINGLIVPKNCPKKLAEAINYVTDNSKIAKLYGEAGYTTAIIKFSPNNIQLYEQLYDKVLMK